MFWKRPKPQAPPAAANPREVNASTDGADQPPDGLALLAGAQGSTGSDEKRPPTTSSAPGPAARTASSAEGAGGGRASLDKELEAALDAMACVFRAIGRHAFDLPNTEARDVTDTCEGWASHLLLRTPAPSADVSEPDDKKLVPRNWHGAVKYLTGLRKEEHSHLFKALSDLRQVIWAFAHGLNQALVADEKTDDTLKNQLSRLTNAAKHSTPEELKREAFSIADGLGQVFEARRKAQLQQAAEFGARLAALGSALEEARREVALDPLTRLFNRRTFDEELVRTVDLRGLAGGEACLVLVDVDHFKVINDQYGHPAGDEVLRQLTGALARTFRHRDDVVARYGGEEFAIILRDTKLKDARMLVDRLLTSVRALKIRTNPKATPIQITVSAGLSQYMSGETETGWLSRTDAALYEAKRTGRDRYLVASRPARAA